MADYLDSKGKFDAHKWLRKNTVTGQDPSHRNTINEEYIEGMYDLDDGLALIKDAWTSWRRGPETETSDIKPAQKELINYVSKWLKKNIR
tara:strand:+ start:317 stop:586 length:270 start_codon:yes stop_codon:yes gene_type:complete